MPRAKYRLSILDHIHRREGMSLLESFDHMTRFACAADQWGFKRLWFSEHHENPMYASCAPEIAIPLIASRTKTIRIGSGGVMLSNYRPAKVAETFNLLSLLYPNRIDLGIGFASGGTPEVAAQLRTAISEDPADKLEALHVLGNRASELTGSEAQVETWILSSGGPDTLNLAMEHKLGLVLAHFLNPGILSDGVLAFQKSYEARWGEKARIIVAIDLITGKDRLALRKNLQYRALHSALMRRAKNNVAFPTAEDLLSRCSAAELSEAITGMERVKIIGTFDDVAKIFAKFQTDFAIEEFMVHFYAPDPSERLTILAGLADMGTLSGERP